MLWHGHRLIELPLSAAIPQESTKPILRYLARSFVVFTSLLMHADVDVVCQVTQSLLLVQIHE